MGGQAYHCAAAADHNGHAILHTIYEMALKFTSLLSIEYFAMDLIMEDDSKCPSCTAMCMEDGSIYRFGAHSHIHGNRWIWPCLSVLHFGAHLHQGWQRHGQSGRPSHARTWILCSSIQQEPSGHGLYIAACGVEPWVEPSDLRRQP